MRFEDTLFSEQGMSVLCLGKTGEGGVCHHSL